MGYNSDDGCPGRREEGQVTKKGTKGVYNWDEVFAYYLDMTVSGADVCKRFGMAKSTLDRRIEKYGWAALKKKCGKRRWKKAFWILPEAMRRRCFRKY